MDLRFAENTAIILHMLPHWFKERKGSADSIGARFLNIAGLKLDDLMHTIEYAYRQCYIETADIDQCDFCYKAIVPMPLDCSKITAVYSYGAPMIRAKSLKQFFGIDISVKTNALYYHDMYWIDEKRNIVYVRDKFNVDAAYENGYIDFEIDGEHYTQELIPHHVWNFFDEFGLLLCTPRLPEEPNEHYKERILDVFRNPANASRDGLINGIARELDLRTNLTWMPPSVDLELKDSMVVLNSITIDGEPADLKNVYITESNTVLIKALNIKKTSCDVSYVHGLEMHKLWNHNDMKLQNEIFTIDHKAKHALMKYIRILDSECPIFWNKFHWNEHYWDPNDYNVTGYGTIPTLYDGSVRGFQNYE